MRRYIGLVLAIVFLVFQSFTATANAAELDPEVRTLPLNSAGDTVVLSLKQAKQGQRIFNYACAQCHVRGITKTDPNVGLDTEALDLATPQRNNIEALVDYMNNPTTYDGLVDISELHPSTKSSDIYPKMRNLTQDDLFAIAGHILLQPKVDPGRWGVGKARGY